MVHTYKFAIIRLFSNKIRDERLNIGAVIIDDDEIDVRVTRHLDRVKAISAAIDPNTLRELLANIQSLDQESRREGITSTTARLENLARLGPLSISPAGTFVAENTDYEAHVDSLLQLMVEPEPTQRKPRQKRTRLYADIKKRLRQEKILARNNEGLESQRVVSGFEVDDGLVADLLLLKKSYYVIQTVDASGEQSALRKAISDIAVSALVMERARMRFGSDVTQTKLVYSTSAALERLAQPSLDAAEHQGAELFNWLSISDRNKFLELLAMTATPIDAKKQPRLVMPAGGGSMH